MRRFDRRSTLVLASLGILGGLAPAAGLLYAQIRVCYVEMCTTKNGVTICHEKEVPCPSPT